MRYLSRRLSVDAQLQRLGRGSMPISPVLGRQGTRVAQQPDGALEAGELGALGSGAAERSSSDARGARVEHGAQVRLRGRREAQHLEAVGVRVVAAEQQRDREREQARLRLEEEAKKNPGQRLVPEFGSEKDFPLQQALNQLKGKPVMVSKTLTERAEEKKDN